MNKSRVPFKTNVNQRIPKAAVNPSNKPAQSGYWLRSQDRPIRARVVNQRKERKQLAEWILVWVTAIPVGLIVTVWMGLLVFDMFTT